MHIDVRSAFGAPEVSRAEAEFVTKRAKFTELPESRPRELGAFKTAESEILYGRPVRLWSQPCEDAWLVRLSFDAKEQLVAARAGRLNSGCL